jgi:RimJ/RimL family protein N-acetyltransferase
MPAIPLPPARLSDGVVELRLAAEWDIPDILIAHQDDPSLHRALGLTRPPSGAELGREIERLPAEMEAGTAIALTILEPGSEDCRGRIQVGEIRWEDRRAELTLWVAPQLRGRGVARRALRLAAAWLFDVVGLERLVLATAPAEPGSAEGAGGLVLDPRCLELQRGEDRAGGG